MECEGLSCASLSLDNHSPFLSKSLSRNPRASLCLRIRLILSSLVQPIYDVSAGLLRGAQSCPRRLSAFGRGAEELAVPAASVQHAVTSAAMPPMRSSNKHQGATLDSSTVASTASQMEKVAEIVRLARFDGSYTPSQRLQQLTGINEHDSLAWGKKQWNAPVSLPVLTTVRVLAHLSGEYDGQRATWRLVSQKAEKWLNTQQPEWKVVGVATVDELVMAAASWPRP